MRYEPISRDVRPRSAMRSALRRPSHSPRALHVSVRGPAWLLAAADRVAGSLMSRTVISGTASRSTVPGKQSSPRRAPCSRSFAYTDLL